LLQFAATGLEIFFPFKNTLKNIPALAKPDGSAYASPFHKLYVSDERGKALIIVDVDKDIVVKTLNFKSEAGMVRYDPVAKKIYLNLQDQNLFAVIDPTTDTVKETFSVGKCQGNHGMALDPENHLAFLACEENNLISVFNLDQHKTIIDLTIPSGVDVIEFDTELKRLYAACGSGAISVIQEENPSLFRKLEDFKVQPKIHSLAVDLKTHKVYAPAEQEDGKSTSKMFIFKPILNLKH
jgi:DNA-binding beta-propeller fold protein YncE